MQIGRESRAPLGTWYGFEGYFYLYLVAFSWIYIWVITESLKIWVITESLKVYNTKLKAQRVCFEIDPNLRGLYAIWPKRFS